MPNQGIVFSNQLFEASSKIITKTYSKTVEQVKPQFQEVFNDYQNDPKRNFLTFLAIRGMRTASIMPEGTAPALQSINLGESQTFNFVDYGLSYAVTRRALEYDPAGILARAPRFLAYSMQITQELLIWQILNLATQVNGFDGVSLLSTAHPLAGQPGTTFSNYLGNAALSVESLHAAFLMMQLTVDDNGLPTYRTPRMMVVSPYISQQAMEILGAKGYPYSNENRPNVVADSVRLIVSRWITGNTAWYVLANKGEIEGDTHSLFYSFQIRNRQRTWVDPATETMFHADQFRLTYGFVTPYGIVGSLGS